MCRVHATNTSVNACFPVGDILKWLTYSLCTVLETKKADVARCLVTKATVTGLVGELCGLQANG